jgi:hypothetical protein
MQYYKILRYKFLNYFLSLRRGGHSIFIQNQGTLSTAKKMLILRILKNF